MMYQNMTKTCLPAYNPKGVKIALGTLCSLSVAIGTPLVCIIIKYLIRASQRHGQAINRLMLFEHAVTSLNVVTIVLQILVLALPFPMGRVVCTTLEVLVINDGIYRSTGSVGMALFRSV